MEPRSIERGKPFFPCVVLLAFFASMEPRSIERGKYLGTEGDDEELALQWSRDQLNAERLGLACRSRSGRLLQWSRDQLNAERSPIGWKSRKRRCFNGAAIN